MEENPTIKQELQEEDTLVQEEVQSEETLANEFQEEQTNKESGDASEDECVTEEEPDKAAEYLERLQRLMAEFDNFRKRSEKEKADSYDYAISNTIVELLTVIDNFERALKVESADKAFYTGVEMIYKQFLGILEKLGVTPIEAEGQVFNPNLHNAILHIEDEAYGENTIVEELQKGYQYKERVIRYSMVKVAN